VNKEGKKAVDMPELPEVETIRRDLSGAITGEKIISVTVNDERVIKGLSAAVFTREIVGRSIAEVLRKGKVLVLGLSGGKYIIIHLRIAGWLLHGECRNKSRVSFKFSDGNFLNYMDQRVLGEVRLIDDYREFSLIKRLGPEPFEITSEQFFNIIKSRKTNIKNLLMNQEIISGIGNIYAQEGLFLSGINPQRAANSLSPEEGKKLHKNVSAVLREAIKNKGSSIDLYRDVWGNKGGMEKRLKIYEKKGQLCPACRHTIVKITIAGRGTCFCPYCQK
jgi:formamidopyrimidine-DNA glycosylase